MSDENQSAQEKTHEPTARRLEKAREQGNVAQSQDAQTLAAYLGFSVAMGLGAGWVLEALGRNLKTPLIYPEEMAHQFLHGGASEIMFELLGRIGGPSLLFIALPATLILALLLAQRSLVFAPEKIHFKLSRISPVDNAKQKYGPKGLVEFAKSSAKVLAISLVLGLVLLSQAEDVARYAHVPARQAALLLEEQFWSVMIGVLVVAAAIAFFDVLWQRHAHFRDNMMTHQELKEETKQSEGDPQMRASRRERARQIATNEMLRDVPKADVLLVNPTHFAVALKWDRSPGSVPRCLGKGVDQIALTMRRVAEESGVPIQEDPATTRAVHAVVEIGQEIQSEHYKAVAAAIVFADQLRAKRRQSLFGV